MVGSEYVTEKHRKKETKSQLPVSCHVRYTYKQIASALFHPTQESARADKFQGPECYFVGFFIAQQSSFGSEATFRVPALLTSGTGVTKPDVKANRDFLCLFHYLNSFELSKTLFYWSNLGLCESGVSFKVLTNSCLLVLSLI